MTSIKVKFCQTANVFHSGTVIYQLIHERSVRQLSTGYCLRSEEWNKKRSMPLLNPNSKRYAELCRISDCIRNDVRRLKAIDVSLSNGNLPYTVDDVVDSYKRFVCEYSLFNFMDAIILSLRRNGRVRTAETYSSAYRSFKRFLAEWSAEEGNEGWSDVMIDCIDANLMEAYEAWLLERGLRPNTTSFYARIFRAVYNRALDNEIIENRNPFRRVYMGIDKTIKRALPLSVIKQIKKADLCNSPALDYARDMFMMSFYLRGMSFVDMAFLRKTDLSNGYIIYRRRKTGQQLMVKWTKEMSGILSKYPEVEGEYLLPVIRATNMSERNIYRNASYNINRGLKAVASMLGISVPLTLYVARHSWASAARSKGVPLSVISEGMGHESETTTRIYLASLDTSLVDKANSLIISAL